MSILSNAPYFFSTCGIFLTQVDTIIIGIDITESRTLKVKKIPTISFSPFLLCATSDIGGKENGSKSKRFKRV